MWLLSLEKECPAIFEKDECLQSDEIPGPVCVGGKRIRYTIPFLPNPALRFADFLMAGSTWEDGRGQYQVSRHAIRSKKWNFEQYGILL